MHLRIVLLLTLIGCAPETGELALYSSPEQLTLTPERPTGEVVVTNLGTGGVELVELYTTGEASVLLAELDQELPLYLGPGGKKTLQVAMDEDAVVPLASYAEAELRVVVEDEWQVGCQAPVRSAWERAATVVAVANDLPPADGCDLDGDGHASQACGGDDCDDLDPTAFAGAVERCGDGVDEDCDGEVDEDDAVDAIEVYADLDADGYGDPNSLSTTCQPSAEEVRIDGDCDDSDPQVHPGAEERCDGVDEDCDGTVDEGAAEGSESWYLDADGDGSGDPLTETQSCTVPGEGWVEEGSDCNDADATVYPGAEERCDGTDQDCDGSVDEESVDASTWYYDGDGDGYGDPAVSETGCEPSGPRFVADGSDCDDGSVLVHPGAEERCDGRDGDCNGVVDDATDDGPTWYTDADGDGFGDAGSALQACAQPAGTSELRTDCNDDDASVYPGAEERCDGIDGDCDGSVDEGSVDASTWFRDNDGDGFGWPDATFAACEMPSGYADNDQDCVDGDASIFPGAEESCNGSDDDCDGAVDESPVDGTSFYLDADGDLFGNSTEVVVECRRPDGYVTEPDDCDDADGLVHPGAPERCDGLDGDCDGQVDDEAPCPCELAWLDGRAYQLCTSPETWDDAAAWCNSYGYHLATIEDAEEDAWLDAEIDLRSEELWWAGGTDRGDEGVWRWDDLTPWSYSHWHSGQPNDGTTISQDCLELNRFDDGSWNDYECDEPARFVCESEG